MKLFSLEGFPLYEYKVTKLAYLLISMVHGSGKKVSKGVSGSCIKILALHLGTPQTGKTYH